MNACKCWLLLLKKVVDHLNNEKPLNEIKSKQILI